MAQSVIKCEIHGIDGLVDRLKNAASPSKMKMGVRQALAAGAGVAKKEAEQFTGDSDEDIAFVAKHIKVIGPWEHGDMMIVGVGGDKNAVYPPVGRKRRSKKSYFGEARPWIHGGAAYERTAASVLRTLEFGNKRTPAKPFLTGLFERVKSRIEYAIMSKLGKAIGASEK